MPQGLRKTLGSYPGLQTPPVFLRVRSGLLSWSVLFCNLSQHCDASSPTHPLAPTPSPSRQGRACPPSPGRRGEGLGSTACNKLQRCRYMFSMLRFAFSYLFETVWIIFLTIAALADTSLRPLLHYYPAALCLGPGQPQTQLRGLKHIRSKFNTR